MNRSLLSFVATVLAVLSLAALQARADLIPWSYSWMPSSPEIKADSPGTGRILLTEEPGATAAGSSDVVATNISTYSKASPQHPDHFTDKAYTLTVTLTDMTSSDSGKLTFAGLFSGELSSRNSNIRNTFTGLVTQSLTLGGDVYTVTMDSYVAPSPPAATNLGAIGAHAQVTVHPVCHNPEPSTLVLAGLALAVAALVVWRISPGRRVAGADLAGD